MRSCQRKSSAWLNKCEKHPSGQGNWCHGLPRCLLHPCRVIFLCTLKHLTGWWSGLQGQPPRWEFFPCVSPLLRGSLPKASNCMISKEGCIPRWEGFARATLPCQTHLSSLQTNQKRFSLLTFLQWWSGHCFWFLRWWVSLPRGVRLVELNLCEYLQVRVARRWRGKHY